MQITCPKCKAVMEAGELKSGDQVICGNCDAPLAIPETALEPGSVFADFRIESVLGKGGMGLVYKAHQISLDRPAAVKVLKSNFAGDKEAVEQFIKEARAAAKINHPNIVQAYAVGEFEGRYYFAMELIGGESMKKYLAREKAVEPKMAAGIVRDIAKALDCAWTNQKLVHHDIKPDNIMLAADGSAKLADLGLAKVGGEHLEDDGEEVLGTPQYINPEQLTGEPTTTKSDIYSLGATFYHFLTGKFPFYGDTVEEMTRKHLEADLVPPVSVNGNIPKRLSDIVLRMMAKSPENRPDGAELNKMLTDFLEGGKEDKNTLNTLEPQKKLEKKLMSDDNNAAKISIKPKSGAEPAESAPKFSVKKPPAESAQTTETDSQNVRSEGSHAAKIAAPQGGTKLATGKSYGGPANATPPVVRNLGRELNAKKKSGKLPGWLWCVLLIGVLGGGFYLAWTMNYLPEYVKADSVKFYTIAKDYVEGLIGKAPKTPSTGDDSSKTPGKGPGKGGKTASGKSGAAPRTVVDQAKVDAFIQSANQAKESIAKSFVEGLAKKSATLSGVDESVNAVAVKLTELPEDEEKAALANLKEFAGTMTSEYQACMKLGVAIKDPSQILDRPIELPGRQLVNVTGFKGDKLLTKSLIDGKEIALNFNDPKIRQLVMGRIARALKLKNLDFYIDMVNGNWNGDLAAHAPNDFWKANIGMVQEAGKKLQQ